MEEDCISAEYSHTQGSTDFYNLRNSDGEVYKTIGFNGFIADMLLSASKRYGEAVDRYFQEHPELLPRESKISRFFKKLQGGIENCLKGLPAH